MRLDWIHFFIGSFRKIIDRHFNGMHVLGHFQKSFLDPLRQSTLIYVQYMS